MIPKLIALDLDETTLNGSGGLSPENQRAMEAAIQMGIHVVVATGRPLGALPKMIRNFPGIRYAITGNGAEVYDLETGASLRRFVMTEKSVEEILQKTAGEPVAYQCTIRGESFAQEDFVTNPEKYNNDPVTVEYVRKTRVLVPDMVAFIREHQRELDSVDVVTWDQELKHRLTERLQTVDSVYITSSVARLIEISNEASGKHRGLQFLADLLSVPREATAAFGNGDNDAEMLRWAGVGVSVAGGSEACRDAADHVTDTHFNNGVAKAFKELWNIG